MKRMRYAITGPCDIAGQAHAAGIDEVDVAITADNGGYYVKGTRVGHVPNENVTFKLHTEASGCGKKDFAVSFHSPLY